MTVQNNSIHRIAILADTHSLLRPEIREVLQGCEVILHAGDIASRETYDEIGKIAPAYFVQGNADEKWTAGTLPQEERADEAEGRIQLPTELDVELFGFHFYMIHKKKEMRTDLTGVDIALYGHSHKYEEVRRDGILYLNPGSCGPRRFTQPITMAVMTIDEEKHTYEIERIDCRAESKTGGKSTTLDSNIMGIDSAAVNTRDMDKLIRSIVKDMRANRTVDKIAERNMVSVDFVNQILQIYTTHPGIDVEGIMNRMDIWGR